MDLEEKDGNGWDKENERERQARQMRKRGQEAEKENLAMNQPSHTKYRLNAVISSMQYYMYFSLHVLMKVLYICAGIGGKKCYMAMDQ